MLDASKSVRMALPADLILISIPRKALKLQGRLLFTRRRGKAGELENRLTRLEMVSRSDKVALAQSHLLEGEWAHTEISGPKIVHCMACSIKAPYDTHRAP